MMGKKLLRQIFYVSCLTMSCDSMDDLKRSLQDKLKHGVIYRGLL